MSYLTSLNTQLFKNIAYVGSFDHILFNLIFNVNSNLAESSANCSGRYLDGVFPSPVPLDQADDKADAKEEDDGEQHPDEPAGGGEGALLRLVPGRDVQVRVHALNNAVVITDV